MAGRSKLCFEIRSNVTPKSTARLIILEGRTCTEPSTQASVRQLTKAKSINVSAPNSTYTICAASIMAPADPPRPSMRRKSSAQNLLSTFNKSTQPGAPSGSTTPSVPHYPVPNAPPSSFTSAASSIITASTPTAREWDAQSLHSDGTASTAAQSVASQPFTQASVEYLRDMVQKRIITLTYMRNVHEGCVDTTSA